MPQKPLTIRLNDPRAIEKWRQAIDYDEQSDDAPDADVFVKFYEKFLKDNPTFISDYPEAAAVYEELYSRALWISLPLRREAEGLGLFASRLPPALCRPDIDLTQKTRQWLLNFPLASRDEIKKKLLELLAKSDARLSAGELLAAEARLAGTVGNWLRNYQNAVGAETSDTLARSQYFFSNQTFTRLTEGDQSLLRRFFALIDFLKFSSLTPEGFEEELPIPEDESGTVLVQGREHRTPTAVLQALAALKLPKSGEERRRWLSEQLRGSDAEVRELQKYEEEYQKSSGDDAVKLRAALAALVGPSPGKKIEPLRVVAVLRRLARRGALDDLLQADERLADLLARHYREAGETQELDDFRVYPTAPKHLAALFQLLLVKVARLSESEAARFTIQIGNLMRHVGNDKYLNLAHFDEETGAFGFAQPLGGVSRGQK